MKTKQILFHGAWLLTAVAALTGCSSENELTDPVVPTKTTWTVVVNAEKTIDDATRAVNVSGSKLSTTWETTDKVYVIKADGSVPNGNFAPQATGSRTATLVTTNLEGDYAVGDVLTLRSLSPTRTYASQKGTIENVSANHAFMEAEVTVTAVDTEAKTLTLSDATFKHCQAFLKLKFTDGTNALAVSELKISDQANFTLLQVVKSDGAKQYEDLTITPTTATSELFVALHNDHTGAVEYTLTATVGGEIYKATKTVPASIVDGKYGTTTITLTKEAYHAQGNPLTFESVNGGNFTLTYSVGSNVGSAKPIEYSTNNGSSWTSIAGAVGQSYTMTGTKIMVRGNNSAYGSTAFNPSDETNTDASYSSCFNSSTDHYVYGNIMSLISSTGYATLTTLTGANAFTRMFFNNTHLKSHATNELVLPATTLTTWCYAGLFDGCTGLTRGPELPAKVMKDYCYWAMFNNSGLTQASVVHSTELAAYCYYAMYRQCYSLTSVPALPATTLAPNCYNSMFQDDKFTTGPVLPAMTLAESCYRNMFSRCSNLTTAPELPATTLAKACYYSLFVSCTSLTTAPELPATTLAEGCYDGMFWECTALTTAPATLPATTLAKECYNYMFYKCTSLTTAPTLPAPTLVEKCYYAMFNNCSKLNYVKCMATNISASNCLYVWVGGVANSGTLVKKRGFTGGWVAGTNYPRGWALQEADE